MLRKNFRFLTRLGVFPALLVAALLFAGAGGAVASEDDEMAAMELSEEALKEKIKKIVVPNLAGEPVVDAVFDEPFWEKAAVMKLEREVWPTQLAPAVVATEVRIVRLGDYLMLGFTARDPDPDKIRAPWRDRDGIDTDDYVSFSFDPAGKNATVYELKVSASGIQADYIRNRIDNRTIRDWDAAWDSAARIVSDGYLVEMRLPLAEFDWPMHKGVIRFIAFKRHYPRKERRILGAFAVVIVPEETPDLEKNVVVVPTFTFEYEVERPLTGEDRSWEGQDNPTVSLDVAYRPTPSLSLLATVNPDYLQVEADLAKSSINNAFTAFQPEKRRFFTANQDDFSSLLFMIYTRNIERPAVGAKLAGSVRDVTMGNFLIQDKDLKLIVPGNLSSKTKTLDDADSLSGALRYRWDVRPGLSLGALATGRAGVSGSDVSDYHSVAGGLDGYLKIGRYGELRGQWLYSDTEYPEALVNELCEEDDACEDSAADPGLPGESSYNEQVLRADPDKTYRDDALTVYYKHWERKWYFIGRYADVGADFRGDLGFMKKIDYRLGNARAGYTWYFGGGGDDDGEATRRLRPSVSFLRQEDQSGSLLMESREVWLQYWGASQSHLRLIYRNRDRVANRFLQNTLELDDNAPEFNEEQLEFRFESPPWRNMRFFLEGTFGNEIDKDNYRLGDVLRIEPEVRLYAGDRLELSLTNTFKQLDVDGGRLFTENYLRLSLTYKFRKRSFARFTYIDDYIRRDPNLYLFEEEDRLEREHSGELLVAWAPGRQNLFFFGLKGGSRETDETNGPVFDNWTFYIKYGRAFSW